MRTSRRVFGTDRCTITIAMTANGMFTQKIHRQLCGSHASNNGNALNSDATRDAVQRAEDRPQLLSGTDGPERGRPPLLLPQVRDQRHRHRQQRATGKALHDPAQRPAAARRRPAP